MTFDCPPKQALDQFLVEQMDALGPVLRKCLDATKLAAYPGINLHWFYMRSQTPSPISLSSVRFELDCWTISPDRNQLRNGNSILRIEPKTMHVLVFLAERHGQVVTRESLMEAVWADVLVTEGTLSRCISQLRKAFGDDSRAPTVIETIPTVGYRLIASVRISSGGDGVADNNLESDAPAMKIEGSKSKAQSVSWKLPTTIVVVVFGLLIGVLTISSDAGFQRSLPTTRPLTATPGIEHSAAISPNGQFVAFIGPIQSSLREGLFVKSFGTDTPLLISDPESNAQYPSWTPDGGQISYFACDEQDSCRLLQTSAFGKDTRQLDHAVQRPWGLTSSPNGKTLVFSAQDTSAHVWRLMQFDIDSATREWITEPPTTIRGDLNPVFSPDGRTIAFKRSVGEGVGDIYRVVSQGDGIQRLTFDGATVAGQTWTPDGSVIIFSSNRNGLFQLWSVDAIGGTPVRLSDVAAHDPGFPVLSATGDRLIFEEWMIDVNVWSARSGHKDSLARRVVASSWWNKYPSISPDGGSIAFVSARTGTAELWIAQVDGSHPRRISDFGGAGIGPPSWSPNSRRLAFELIQDGQADIWVVDTEGGSPQRVTTNDADDRTPSWSNAGETIYFASDRSGTWQIWQTPATGGDAMQITDAGGRRAIESVDGSILYLSRFGEPGLWALDLSENELQLVTRELDVIDWGNWAVGSKGPVWVRRQNSSAYLYGVNSSNGDLVPLGMNLDGLVRDDPGLTLAPDLSYVLYAKVERSESDLAYADKFALPF